MKPLMLSVAFLSLALAPLAADGPGDNIADKVRRVPPPGMKLDADTQADLSARIGRLGQVIIDLRAALKGKPVLLELLPDVQIFHNAARYALEHDEFHKGGEVKSALKLLDQGMDRAAALHKGEAPWTKETGLVVRGYQSKIDDSVQPYGLVVPPNYKGGGFAHRLDIWFHGRGETLSEVNFLEGRQKDPGQFTPRGAFVLHPYGRYCNANHFAGEVDTFEALEHVRKHYLIDENRIFVRGFSMGGAACWHFAVHHASKWAGAAPGAGFSETPDFLKVFQNEKLDPPDYEKKLWHLYDCNDYALNLFNCPTVAYSGEKDKQKQAADVMEKAMAVEGLKLVHIIGAGAGHSYTPAAKVEINRRLDSIAAIGRDTFPAKVLFTTWTLRYNQMHWVTIDNLGQHWEQAKVEADRTEKGAIVKTKNVTGLTLSIPPGYCPFDANQPTLVVIDGQELKGGRVMSDRSWTSHFRKYETRWKLIPEPMTSGKVHGLQGPIDDAFMDRFIFVRPTGKAYNDKTAAWVKNELAHAVTHWRQQFRGEVIQKDDTQITPADEASANLILWGDPSSNRYLAKLNGKLPITWNNELIKLEKKTYSADHHVPAFICPNPLAPKKYVVLNSGFTFREYDYLNNARQVPKLPDWAILDVNQPPTSRRPAGIAAAGFFSEMWE